MSRYSASRSRRPVHLPRLVFFAAVALVFLIVLVRLIFAVRTALSPSAPADLSAAGGAQDTADTSSVQTDDLSSLPEELAALYEKNPDAREFVRSYWDEKDISHEIDLSDLHDTASVPLLMQWDKRWGYETYAGGLLGLTGCGPTCLSMAAIYLTGDESFDPLSVAQFSESHGYSVDGQGSSWSLMSDGAQELGLESQELPLSEARMAAALAEGKIVICVLGPGDFTDSGHFIVLTGYLDGTFTVHDPNSYANSSRTWTYQELEHQIRNIWALSC